ncbi:MAG TPA: helix-turn-helix transcriptional regulator [Mycobacteriales bacterium]|jgi:predicted XRE-type DNA-binding protein|nr:helix-turn-helix transcriptional regulator [Mycobacteriales bacterium]
MARSSKWRDVRDRVPVDEQLARDAEKEMRELVRAHRLADVRKTQGATQKDVAGLMSVSQARVSKIETGDLTHTELGTLSAYVQALGGKLRVVAEFGDETITVA